MPLADRHGHPDPSGRPGCCGSPSVGPAVEPLPGGGDEVDAGPTGCRSVLAVASTRIGRRAPGPTSRSGSGTSRVRPGSVTAAGAAPAPATSSRLTTGTRKLPVLAGHPDEARRLDLDVAHLAPRTLSVAWSRPTVAASCRASAPSARAAPGVRRRGPGRLRPRRGRRGPHRCGRPGRRLEDRGRHLRRAGRPEAQRERSGRARPPSGSRSPSCRSATTRGPRGSSASSWRGSSHGRRRPREELRRCASRRPGATAAGSITTTGCAGPGQGLQSALRARIRCRIARAPSPGSAPRRGAQAAVGPQRRRRTARRAQRARHRRRCRGPATPSGPTTAWTRARSSTSAGTPCGAASAAVARARRRTARRRPVAWMPNSESIEIPLEQALADQRRRRR